MRIIPAIDLQHGKCVRLFQGQYDKVTEYSDDPVSIARKFAELNVADMHIVDLDGARTGQQQNTDAIRQMANATTFSIQVGGGIRYAAVLEHWFDNGVDRCVIGSLALQAPDKVKDWIAKYGAERIVLALDVQVKPNGTPMVATQGWTTTTNRSLWRCLDDFTASGIQHVLCTDISRDGAMTGPNVELYADIVQRYPSIQLQASGGVRNTEDLSELESNGVAAAITGRALLDGAVTPEEIGSFQRGA